MSCYCADNALFDASQYEFFGQNVVDEVELGGLEAEEDDKILFGSADNEYHLFEREGVNNRPLNLMMGHQANIC